ncbi:MAG TPA: helix-turn-helix domain-containing protein [Candidatus Nanoarchaeia archaeon]|nr:helix-turn-helix domain-containing protein [Candidatus Nanoarchaeia archaeon]
MIVQKEFLHKLKDFGINSYESKLWTALLSRGVSTAGELSDIADVPRSRSYDVLESLEKKGFIVMKVGKPIKYIAVPPSEVLERVKKRIKEDSEQHTKIVDELNGSEILNELTLLHSQGIDLVDPSDVTGSIKGRNNIMNHIESAIKNTEKNVLIVTSEQGLVRKLEIIKKVLDRNKGKKIEIRIIAPLTKDSQKFVREYKSYCEIRHTDKLKARFCVVDGKEMIFMITDDEEIHPSYDTGIWINSKFFSGAINHVFNESWNNLKKN